ncbi:MAG TPA: hypothetical protein VG013_16175 [Gemmataceae bacterium]|jgi:hypothetical protein|nr:hypothetical protein [Gemmataceae bacterium]
MRSIGLAFAVLLVSGSVAPTQAATPGPLDGNWFIAHRAYTPSDARDPIAQGIIALGYGIKIQNGTVTATDAGAPNYSIAIAFDQSNPQAVDFVVGGGQLVVHGIYRIEENVLSIAVGFGSARPTTFDDTTNQMLVVMTPVSNP